MGKITKDLPGSHTRPYFTSNAPRSSVFCKNRWIIFHTRPPALGKRSKLILLSLETHSYFPVTTSSTPAPWGFSIGMCAQVTETSWKVLTSSCSRLILPSRSTLLPRCKPDDKKQKPKPRHESSEFKTAAFSLTMWLTLTTHRIPMKAITVNSQRLATALVLTAPL